MNTVSHTALLALHAILTLISHTYLCIALCHRQCPSQRAVPLLKSPFPQHSSNSDQVKIKNCTYFCPYYKNIPMCLMCPSYPFSPEGVPGVFNVTVKPAASFSVDMYLLMDLTLTMFQDLSNLKTFAADLGIPVLYKIKL